MLPDSQWAPLKPLDGPLLKSLIFLCVCVLCSSVFIFLFLDVAKQSCDFSEYPTPVCHRGHLGKKEHTPAGGGSGCLLHAQIRGQGRASSRGYLDGLSSRRLH